MAGRPLRNGEAPGPSILGLGYVGPSPRAATNSAWGDLRQSLPLPSLSFLTYEMGTITPPLGPSPHGGTPARLRGRESALPRARYTATRGRERLLLDCDSGALFPGKPGQRGQAQAALDLRSHFWDGSSWLPFSAPLCKMMIIVYLWWVSPYR